MNTLLAALLLAAALDAEPRPSQQGAPKEAQDTKKEAKEAASTLEDVPPAVREAIQAHSRGATLRGVSKELEPDGKTLYEVELTVAGRTKDLMLDGAGKLVSVEEQAELGEIPEAARTAILKAVGTGKLVLLEKVTKGETTFYEGHVERAGQLSEVKVDASGKPVR